MVTARRNILRVLEHEQPEWVPICGHCDPWNQPNREGMDPGLAIGMGPVGWCDESTIAFSRYLGLDIIDFVPPPVAVTRRCVSVDSVQDDRDTITTWHTPAGDLREVLRLCRDEVTSYRVEHAVKSPADLPALAAIFDDMELTLDDTALGAISQRRELIGDDGILMCFLDATPLGMMYRVYSGPETLAYLWADARQADARRTWPAVEVVDRLFAILARTAADAQQLRAGVVVNDPPNGQ